MPQREATVLPGDQLNLHHPESDTTLVCFVVRGDMRESCAVDRFMLGELRKRIETLQRLVDRSRNG